MRRAAIVALVGPSEADPPTLLAAEDIGAGLAVAGITLATGGLGGVMEAASRGARSKLGSTIGVLPGDDPEEANGWVELPIATGLGEGRNAVLVRLASAVVAVGGGYGTLAEIALALRAGKPVVGLGTWEVHGVEQVSTAEAAVERVAALSSR